MSSTPKTDDKRSSAASTSIKPDVDMADAADEDVAPSPSPPRPKPRKQLRTIPSTTHLGSHRPATASPATHVGDRSATRKASRRDLIMGNTDNVQKPTPQQPLQHRRSGVLGASTIGEQARSSSVNSVRPQSDALRYHQLHDPSTILAAQQLQSMATSQDVGRPQREMQELLRRSALATPSEVQQQQRTSMMTASVGELQQELSRRSTLAGASASQQHRGPPLAGFARPRQTQVQPSSNIASGPAPAQQVRRSTNSLPGREIAPQEVRARVSAGLRQTDAVNGEPSRELRMEGINHLMNGMHMVAEHVRRERGLSRGEVAWAINDYMQTLRERIAQGLPLTPSAEVCAENLRIATENADRVCGRRGLGRGGGESGGRGE